MLIYSKGEGERDNFIKCKVTILIKLNFPEFLNPKKTQEQGFFLEIPNLSA